MLKFGLDKINSNNFFKKAIFFLLFWIVTGVQAQNFIIHKVKEGETLLDIAKQYKVVPSDIIKYNSEINYNGDLKEGQPILIPNFENEVQVKDSIKLTGKIVDYKYHTVGDNETLFSLSKQYNSNIENIVALNNVEGYNIKLGQILIIPIFGVENAEKTIDETKYTYYEVKPKEGKWRVAYDHGITIDELERLNPEIKDQTLQVGQKLIVPKYILTQEKKRDEEHFVYHDVQPKETLYGLSKKYNVSIDEIIALNPELKEGLKFGQTIKFPRKTNIDDDVSSTEKISDFDDKIKLLTQRDTIPAIDTIANYKPYQFNLLDSMRLDKTYRLAIMLPFKLKKIDSLNKDEYCSKITRSNILDYYSGIRLAIDSLQNLGMQIHYDVFDTQASPYVTGKILEVTDLSDYDFVIGPVKKDNIEKVARFLEYDNTPIVVHSYKGDEKYRNIIVTSSDKSAIQNHIIQYLKEKSEGKSLNIIYEPRQKQLADTVAVMLGKDVVKIEGKETKKGFSIDADEIEKKLDSEKDNFVILLSNDDSFTFSVLSTLNSLRDQKHITLFTLDDLKLYEDDTNDRMNVFLANLNYHFPAKMTRLLNDKLAKKYKSEFKTLPSFTAVNGFDTTFDLLVRAANADNLFEGLQKIGRTSQTSKVYLYKYEPSNGFHNLGSVILRINPDLELDKVE